MKQTYLHHIYLLLILALGFKTSNATITVDSVHVTISTCPNNGTAKVYARSTNSNAVFLFNVVSGPVTYTQQNDSTFYSLYPGSYTGWVHDVNSFDSSMFAFTVTGNYVAPQDTVIPSPCYQPGQIIGRVFPGTGLAPYQWQIISPDSTPLQVSDTFNNLQSGTYILRVVDGCGIGRVTNATYSEANTGLAFYDNVSPQIYFLNCDTTQISIDYLINNGYFGIPLTFNIYTDNGVQTFHELPVISDTNQFTALAIFSKKLTGIFFGGHLRICITDTCGNSICTIKDTLCKFVFEANFIPQSQGCSTNYECKIQFDAISIFNYSIETNSPLSFILTDTATHLVVDSIKTNFLNNDLFCPNCFVTFPEHNGGVYLLTVKDTCGNIYTNIITWPSTQLSFSTIKSMFFDCLDSTARYYFEYSGFDSLATLEILSGPSFSESSNPVFAHWDTLIYPMFYSHLPPTQFIIGNMAPGSYSCLLYDACGHSLPYSFSVTQVGSFFQHHTIITQCNGLSTLDVTVNANNSAPIELDLLNGQGQSINGTENDNLGLIEFPELTAGVYYLLTQTYSQPTDSFLKGNLSCTSFIDTIILTNRNDSIFKTSAIAACNGVINVSIIVDSANGIPPFQYEIISGPSTFAFQNNPTFLLDSFGTYLVGVMDSCGNIDARYVTVDTGRFDPIGRTGSLCAGGATKLFDVSSPYFTYTWYKPGGDIYIGDTLTIYPLTNADTGVYFVKKNVQINGCRDSAYSSYHLLSEDALMQIQPGSGNLCTGDSIRLCAPAGLTTYLWSNSSTTSCISVTMPGSFSLTAVDSNHCNLVSDTVHIQPYNVTIPVISLTGGTLSVTGTYLTYQWYLNGNIITGATNPALGLLTSGSYTVQVTDINGCIATSAPYIITAISNITSEANLIVSPNPNNTNLWQVTVSAELASALCQLFDINGKEVYTTRLTGTNNTISTNLSAGTYIMRISTSQNIYNIKLVQF